MTDDRLHYCERFIEAMIDLEALLPTRRFFSTLLDDKHLVVKAELSNLAQRTEGNLFSQVVYLSYIEYLHCEAPKNTIDLNLKVLPFSSLLLKLFNIFEI